METRSKAQEFINVPMPSRDGLHVAARVSIWGAAILFLLLIAAFIWGAWLTVEGNSRAQEQAQALLRDVRALRVGESTEGDVQRIVQRYGGETSGYLFAGCPNSDKKHALAILSGGVKGHTGSIIMLRTVLLQLFGYPLWEVSADFTMDHGHLCSAHYHLSTSPVGGPLSSSLSLFVNYDALLSIPDDSPYYISVRHIENSTEYWVRLTSNATDDQKRHAFDFDLSCLNRFGGCQTGCEIMPSVWLDYQEQARAQGSPLPDDEKNNPRCRRLPDSQ